MKGYTFRLVDGKGIAMFYPADKIPRGTNLIGVPINLYKQDGDRAGLKSAIKTKRGVYALLGALAFCNNRCSKCAHGAFVERTNKLGVTYFEIEFVHTPLERERMGTECCVDYGNDDILKKKGDKKKDDLLGHYLCSPN
jgi:hypothetical protein